MVSQEVLPSVKRSGFLPWGAVIASDHRTEFLDLHTEELFGKVEDSTHSSSHIFHTKHPKRTKKYREEVLEKFKKDNLFKAMRKLSKLAKSRGRWSKKIQTKYEEIDKKATCIMLQAEKNCVQTFRFHTSWSLPLMQASKGVRYWNLRVSQEKGRKVSPAVLASAIEAADLTDNTTSYQHIIINRNLVRIKLRDRIKNVEELRVKELRKKAEDAALEGDAKLTRSYKMLLKNEQCKAKWRKIKYYLQSGDTEPLTRLLVTKGGQQRILIDGAEIQDAVIDHNIKHFSEAEDTPLGMGTFLYKAIGPHGTSEFCDRVLDGGLGETDKEEINYVEAYELLQHMQRKKQQPTRSPVQWIKDTISELLSASSSPEEDTDSDSDTESEPEDSDLEAP